MALFRQMAVQLLGAIGVWVAVLVLVSVAGMVILRDTGYALTTGLLRFSMVFWKCLLFVLLLDLVFCNIPPSWLGDAPPPLRISRVLAIAFGLVPVLFAVLGAISLASRGNPWEYLPGGPPFALRNFASKYPDLRIETLGFGGTTVAVANGTTRVILDESELMEADVEWNEGGDPSEPERLGGPPPYPGGKCVARIKIRRPDHLSAANQETREESDENDDKYFPPPELRTTKYVYSVGRESTSKVREYYLAWAKGAGQDPNVYGSGVLWMEVPAGGRTWVIGIRGRKDRTVDDVYLEYSETHPPSGRQP